MQGEPLCVMQGEPLCVMQGEPLCVMQGEHQLGRRNSGPCRGRLLLHTTPSLCRLFLFSIFAASVFGSVFVFFVSVFSTVFVLVLVSETFSPARGGLCYTRLRVYVACSPFLQHPCVLSSRFCMSCCAPLKLQIKLDPWRSDLL